MQLFILNKLVKVDHGACNDTIILSTESNTFKTMMISFMNFVIHYNYFSTSFGDIQVTRMFADSNSSQFTMVAKTA